MPRRSRFGEISKGGKFGILLFVVILGSLAGYFIYIKTKKPKTTSSDSAASENTDDYENESSHQKNCVRTYYKQPHNLIVSLRKGSSNGKDRATIEYLFTKNTIVRKQTLGRFNLSLDNTWDIPLHELDKFISYLYSKKMIKLPVMTTKYPNNKVIIKESKFIIDDDLSHSDYPKWDGESNKHESFFDLMDLF